MPHGDSVSQFGLIDDKCAQADYDGDGKTDIAIFRPSTGDWWILQSSNGAATQTHWGLNGDVAAPGDCDGDGKADLTVYRAGVWYVLKSAGGSSVVSFGLTDDKPVPAGYIPQQ